MKKLYIVVFNVTEWPMETLYFATNNQEHRSVLVIKEEELLLIKKALEIIDEANDSDIKNGNDDWVPMNDVKTICFNALKEYSNQKLTDKKKYIIIEIIKLFELSLNSNDAVCFHYQ